jgi:hypothetical protein
VKRKEGARYQAGMIEFNGSFEPGTAGWIGVTRLWCLRVLDESVLLLETHTRPWKTEAKNWWWAP